MAALAKRHLTYQTSSSRSVVIAYRLFITSYNFVGLIASYFETVKLTVGYF